MQHRDAGLGVVGPPKAEPALTTSMATALASDDFKGVDNNVTFFLFMLNILGRGLLRISGWRHQYRRTRKKIEK
jgi:hypothetical protein